MDDVLEAWDSLMKKDAPYFGRLNYVEQRLFDHGHALAAEVRELRRKLDLTCGYLSDRVEPRWDDELIRVVTEWRDAAMKERSE